MYVDHIQLSTFEDQGCRSWDLSSYYLSVTAWIYVNWLGYNHLYFSGDRIHWILRQEIREDSGRGWRRRRQNERASERASAWVWDQATRKQTCKKMLAVESVGISGSKSDKPITAPSILHAHVDWIASAIG